MPHAVCQVQEAEASGCRRQQRSSPRIGCWSSARQTKPFDGAWDLAKVDQKDLDERRNSLPSWRQSRTEPRTDDGTRSVQTLETSEEATRGNGGVDQPIRNDNAWRVSNGNAN